MGRRPLKPLLYQYVNHQLGVARKAVGFAAVGVKWGQGTPHGLRAMWLQPAEIQGSEGQVGQESNLQPAVLEHSAQCPEWSKVVQIALESTVFRGESSNSVQERLASM
jgi:hypothetical protein